MWFTTSKNAPKELKKAARALADALPGGSFVPRGESRLERLQLLAGRAGERTLLVLMAGEMEGKSTPYFTIRSRHLVLDENGSESWSWDAHGLEVHKVETGQRPSALLGEDPYVIVVAKNEGETLALASFLGLENHPLADFADEPLEVEMELDVKKSKTKNTSHTLKLAVGKEALLSMEYGWAD